VVTVTKVILVSDTHLSPAAPEAEANWDAVLDYVAANVPDFVVHLGDLTLDGAHDPAQLGYARRQLDRLPVPWHAVPGNHDIGDNPLPGAPPRLEVDAGRQGRWTDALGSDCWSLEVSGWRLLGIDAQLHGSGLDAEGQQWSWLAEQLGQGDHGQRIALITHKPITAGKAEMAAAPAYRFWPEPARRRLGVLAGAAAPDLVLSGHVHQFRQLRIDGTDHVWVPTTWAVLPDHAQPVLGTKRCGIVSLEFAGDTEPRPVLVEPGGLAQHMLTADLPDPYRH
jgi:3',5'-cyclic AMP phosphodiesterase CpdA